MSSMEEDSELVRKTLRGESKAFEMIVQRYEQPLLNYIGRMVNQRELALDFTQDVFVKAYTSLKTFNPQYKFSTWLFKIASNLVIDYWRKKKIPALSLDEPVLEADPKSCPQIADVRLPVDRMFELKEMRQRIELALKKIPPRFRELFVWRHVNELSYEEIAQVKDLPVGTIKNRVFQAKEMLRKLLEEKA